MAALRLSRLSDTISAIKAQGATVTVFGDTHAPGCDPQPGQEKLVRQELEALGARVMTGGEPGSVEGGGALEDLIAGHDAFVNDSFQWSYLPLPSLVEPAARLACAAGRSLEHDLDLAAMLLHSPLRPFAAVLGGSNTQLRVHGLQGLVLRADTVLVGGAISLPILEAIGRRRRSGTPEWFLSECRAVIGLAERVQHPVHLPLDLVIRRPDGTLDVCEPAKAPAGDVVDIGPLTAKRFAEVVHGADAVMWAGALGLVEEPPAGQGTLTVADGLNRDEGRIVVIGGDSLAAFLHREGRIGRQLKMISATDSLLELLKNGDLPALPALRD